MGFRDRFRVSPEDRFLAEVSAALGRLPGVEQVEVVGRMALRAHRRGVEPITVSVANLWRSVQGADAGAQGEMIERFAAGLLSTSEVPQAWAEAAPMLRPAVRSSGFGSDIAGDHALARAPLAPFLDELVAVDMDDSMSFASVEHLRVWGVSAGEARARAAANLASGGLPLRGAEDDVPGGWWIEGPDSYQSSWLAVPGALVQAVAPRVDGDLLAFAPNRDRVFLCGSENPRLADVFVWAERAYAEEARPVSPAPLSVRGAGVVQWEPPAGTLARRLVDRALRVLAAHEYGEQTEMLQQRFAAVGEDVFVATLSAIQRDDGTVWTYAVWPRDVTDGLLPAADWIVLVDGQEHSFVPWEVAATEAAGELVMEPAWQPARWRIRGWPPEDVVARWRAAGYDPGTA